MGSSSCSDEEVYERMDHELGYTTEMPTDLSWQEIEEITSYFSEDRKIGSGGYGVVYKGVTRNGEEIAVKKLYHKPGLDEKQFQNELRNLTGLQHRNIVRLLGKSYLEQERCVEYNGKLVIAKMVDRAICLEYLHNGSLEAHLSDESSGLPWQKRYKIIKGICEGLKYLHEQSIFHLDLKPANILLDNNMLPKIADFGLSRLFSGTHKSHTTDNFIGTLGYVPPEYIEKGKISEKFDVFSFGVIIMGIMTGPGGYNKHCDFPSEDFVELVTGNWRTILQKGWNDISYLDAHCQQVKTCIEIAVNCVGNDRHRRPSIGDILLSISETESRIDEFYKHQFVIQPSNLCFPFELDKLTSCPLHLSNKSNQHIAFRIWSEIPNIFIGSLHGIVPPGCTQTYILTMQKQDQAICSDLNNIHIETTASGLYSNTEINKETINSLFVKSHALHDEMKEVKITSSYSDPPESEPKIEILSLNCTYAIDVHPVKPWILTCGEDGNIQVWNYMNKGKLGLDKIQPTHASTVGKFIARKQWFVAGYTDGYIDVYCCETMRRLKHFEAHQAGHIKDLAIHPTDPYVMSASFYEGNVKLWDWEKGWKCTRIFEIVDFHMVYQVRLNLMDTNTFAVRGDAGTKICSLQSPGSNFILDEYDDQDIWSFDYYANGRKQYLIIGGIDGSVEIWDLHTKSLVEAVEGVHLNSVEAVCYHPKQHVLVTGSSDGCVCLWDSTTLRPKRTFNFGLGAVTDVKVCMADSVPVRLSLNGSFRAWKSSVPVQISEEIVQPGFLPMQTNGASRRFASNIKECMDDSRSYRVLISHKGGLAMIEMDQNESVANIGSSVKEDEENDLFSSRKRKLPEQDWIDIKKWRLAI